MERLLPSYVDELIAMLGQYSYAEVLNEMAQLAKEDGAMEIAKIIEQAAKEIHD